jgi:hypothetical protein
MGQRPFEFGRTIVTTHPPVNLNTKPMISGQNTIELTITGGALLVGLVLVAAMAWVERRPRKSINPSLIPTTPLMFMGAFVCLVAVVHLVNLSGIQTGR